MSRIKLNTIKFNEMLTRALKGAGNNKLIPLTNMIGITVKDNTLKLHTTDMTNHLIIKQDNVDGDDFDITINIDILSKLVPRLTSDNIILDIKDNFLNISANGDYKIELPLDEDGDIITFPNVEYCDEDLYKDCEEYTIHSTDVDTILAANRLALAGIDDPIYSNYYVGEKVVSTDRMTLCSYNKTLFNNLVVLLPPQLVELLDIVTDDVIKVRFKDNVVLFKTDSVLVGGILADEVEEYAIEPISQWLNSEFAYKCKVPKQALISALERVSLFIDTFDEGVINLVFDNDCIKIFSNKLTGNEVVKYYDKCSTPGYSCLMDVNTFVSQIKSVSGDSVILEFGNDTCIKINDDDIIKVISTINDEE